MVRTGTTSTWLSVGLAFALQLAFFVPCQGATQLYSIYPGGTAQSGTVSEVWQTIVATADTVRDTVYLFNGAPRDSGNFTLVIQDSASGEIKGTFYAPPDSIGYRWVKFGGVNAPVTRGRTYKFKFSHPNGINYFYDSLNVYPFGRMYLGAYGPTGAGRDLAARITGTGKTIDVWGLNTYLANTADLPTTPIDTMLGVCKAEGVTYMREQVPWRSIQPDSARPDSFNWARTDTLMQLAAARNLNIMWGFWGCAEFASTKADSDTCIVDHQNEFWTHPPKGLQRPVFKSGSGDINPDNYFGYYVYTAVKRYGNGGSHTYGNPIQHWEIWNEENATAEWDYPNRADTSVGYPWVTDSLKLIALYDTLVHVAYQAIKGADPNAKIVMGAMHNTFASWKKWDKCEGDSVFEAYPGVWWLDKFLEYGGGQWIDAYAFHPYQQTPTNGRVQMGLLKQAVDTLRQVLRNRGQGNKPLWANEVGWAASHAWTISEAKQADNFVQFHGAAIEQGTNPKGHLDNLMWYELQNWWPYGHLPEDTMVSRFYGFCGTVNKDDQSPKPMHYAYKQMTGKLKDKYFNRQVPLGNPSDSVYCFEFQIPGSDTCRKTWVIWKSGPFSEPIPESLAVRTTYFDSIGIDYNGSPPSNHKPVMGYSGKIPLLVDSIPQYIIESGNLSRPDVIVDSLWLVSTNPRAREGVWFYARLKNVGNAALSGSVWNSVTFQVDGVSKKTYQIQQQLPVDSSVVLGGDVTADWTANYGDHLIRAWADSADRYVELNEQNNMGYRWTHIRPKVSLKINSDSTFSNHLANNKLHIEMDGNTTPLPDSAKLLHEGSWTRLGVYGSRDTLVAYSYDGVKYDSIIVFQGADRDTAGDSIIVDSEAPYAEISSPTSGQMVSELVSFDGYANDWFQHHLSLWEIIHNCFTWCYDSVEVGTTWPMQWPGHFGDWNSTLVENGYRGHTLVVNDSAGNQSQDTVTVYVNNSGGGDDDGFASGFGSFGSSPVNVATDKKGNVYIPETQGSTLRAFSSKKDTLFSFSARRGNDTTGLAWPVSIVCDPETLSGRATFYIADGYAHAIKKFDRQGSLLLRFGSIGSDTGQFKRLTGIALDWKGRLFVVDQGNHRIQVFDTTGNFLFQFGGLGSDSGKMNTPTGIAITRDPESSSGRRAGWVYVTDTKNHQIQVFDSLGNWKKTIKKPDSLGFDTPTGICSDKHGNVFIADTKNNRIVELNPYGRRLFIFGSQGDSLWQFRNPIGVASSPGAHYLYVADMGNKRVTRFWVIRGDTLGGGGPQSGEIARRIPKVYSLAQSYPNPTTGEAQIEYGLPKESPVRLTVYNVAGQVVREYKPGKQEAGFYNYKWNGRSNLNHKVGAGVYFYRLEAGSWAKTRKMVVIR